MPARLMVVRRSLLFLFLLPWAVLSPVPSGGQSAPATQPALTPTQAQALVERAIATELRTAEDANHPMRYRLRKQSPRLTSTKEIVETRDGDVARLVSIFDRPLSQADEQMEQARLDALLSDPSRQRRRKQSEEGDMRIVLKLLRMLPQAFLYQYAGTGAGPAGKVEKFAFQPNPNFSPPDFEAQALTAMSGEIWIDAAEERVMRLEGHLQQDTDYGWGILGKLDKGGWIVIEQASVGQGQWRIARFQMKMNLRVLFKTRSFDTVEEMTGYAPAPAGIDYRQAIQMLRGGTGSAGQPSR
ncbi:MAG: hypothetical protein ABR912_12940 [Terracidiphilus sp.]